MLDVLDTAGQEEYTGLRDMWIRDGEGFVLVYSITSRNSFTRLRRFYDQVIRVKDTSTDDFTSPPIVIVGNKTDKHDDREVDSTEGILLARELGCHFFETSSKNFVNVHEVFVEVVRELRLRSTHKIGQPGTVQEVPRAIAQTSVSTSKTSNFRRFTTFLFRQPRPTYEDRKLADLKALNVCLVNASRINDYRAVRKFLAKGADPNAQPGLDGAAIHTAAALGHTKIVALLLKSGAAVNAKGPRDVTALQLAAAEGHSLTMQLMLKEGAKVNEVSGLHGTALAAATSRARVEAVRILLKTQADPNVKGGLYGNALQAAAYVGNETVVELLLNDGARVEARGEGDCTALQVACFAGHLGVVKLLITRGSYVDAPGGKYGTALKAANDHGKAEIVKTLLANGASDAGLLPRAASRTTVTDVSTQELANPGEELPLPSQTATELSAPHLIIPPPVAPMLPRVATLRTVELST